MAIPVVESNNTQVGSSVSSIVITKPTGLSEGEMLLATLAMYDATDANRTFSTPSGWTAITNSTTGSSTRLVRTASFYKIADASDVAASNFTFSLSGAAYVVSGCLMRISGQAGSPIVVSESDAGNNSTATISATTALTPNNTTNLLIFHFANSVPSAATSTVSGYASTPSATWTEVADVPHTNTADGIAHGIAKADYASVSQITNRTATSSETGSFQATSAIVIQGIVDASGTNALLSVSPTQFTQSGSCDTNGNNDLLSVAPTLNAGSGEAGVATVWTNTNKS